MKKLSDILYKSSILKVIGSTDIDIHQLSIDSRLAEKGSCFIAIEGEKTNGQ